MNEEKKMQHKDGRQNEKLKNDNDKLKEKYVNDKSIINDPKLFGVNSLVVIKKIIDLNKKNVRNLLVLDNNNMSKKNNGGFGGLGVDGTEFIPSPSSSLSLPSINHDTVSLSSSSNNNKSDLKVDDQDNIPNQITNNAAISIVSSLNNNTNICGNNLIESNKNGDKVIDKIPPKPSAVTSTPTSAVAVGAAAAAANSLTTTTITSTSTLLDEEDCRKKRCADRYDSSESSDR